MKNISVIVAIAENNAIGLDNKLLWQLSDDLKRFKRFTTGHTVIMGRNTFLSLPKGALPNRKNIVISDKQGESFPGCDMAYSIEQALNMAGDDECFIMGGGMIYKQFLPIAGKLYLTTVHQSFEADTYFPEIDFKEWEEKEKEFVDADEKNEFDHTFRLLVRNNNNWQ